VQSKKRRRDDNFNFDNTHQIPLYASLIAKSSTRGTNHPITSSFGDTTGPRGILTDKPFDHGAIFQHHHSSPSAPRKLIPLPLGKRQRTTVDIDVGADGESMQRSPHDFSPRRHDQHREPTKDASREQELDSKTRPPSGTTPSLMNRCHICSRKPNKKSDLDSFADCQGCGQRACYVCIRECLGWAPSIPTTATATATPDALRPDTASTTEDGEGETSFTMLDADAEDYRPTSSEAHGTGHEHGWTKGGGHRQVVCSRCCVEKGQDGDVVCLGCLPFVEG
jgi:hypothetical protein